ncbi:hypothetical protein ACI6PS_12775 [Flavobacterium sp. PLA-1-15]|uniref:hypothetical protein n=1 Tax=Flavobacterium sp. PLA-1-15 TaxID=3380533 RepID=UPI003B788E84
MHFIVSWDIPATIPNRETFENQLRECFRQFRFVKPLTTFYIIEVPSQIEYNNIISALSTLGRTQPGFRFVVSPIMNGGRYNGLLQNDEWTLINQITG